LFMKAEHRTPSPEVIAVKVPTALAAAVREQARQEDRTVSSFVRRIIAAAIDKPAGEEDREP
jgi:hypothetical protein